MANFEDNSLDDPRAFERFLRDKGFSRARAKAITAKGFGEPNTGEAVAVLIEQLKASQERLMTKRRDIDVDKLLRALDRVTQTVNRVRLLPGQSKSRVPLLPVPLGRVRFEIDAPDYAHFECRINYTLYQGHGENAQKNWGDATLFRRAGREKLQTMTIDRGLLSNAVFRNLTKDDLRDFLKRFPENILFGETTFSLEHNRHPDEAIADLPQRAAMFTVRAVQV